jgi:6-phosphogluconate dehydrogenase
MMAGGTEQAWKRVQPVLEAVAAKYDGKPCVARVGSGSAGHYVKMVHNGIEYAVMQILAESYDLMKRGFTLQDDQIAGVFEGWNKGSLNGFLVEIGAVVLRQPNDQGEGPLVEKIQDKAKQKGTGKWASQDAMDIGVPIPSIDAAVAGRIMSGYKELRVRAAQQWQGVGGARTANQDVVSAHSDNWWSKGVELAILISYAQGLDQLRVASAEYGYGTDVKTVAEIWRAGCIIRSALLADIAKAFEAEPGLENLLLAKDISERAKTLRQSLVNMVLTANSMRIPVPSHSASLAYLDGLTSERLPANLIQGMRDYFGAIVGETTTDDHRNIWRLRRLDSPQASAGTVQPLG